MDQSQNTEAPYNRLVIVGNGFDLALGLKTKYSDFFLHYLKETILKYLDDSAYTNDLFRVKVPSRFSIDIHLIKEELKKSQNIKQVLDFTKDYISISGANTFINGLINECREKNWVDIELLYYEKLKQIFLQEHNGDRKRKMKSIEVLNQLMDILTNELSRYISNNQKIDNIHKRSSMLFDLAQKIHYPLDNEYSKLLKKHSRAKSPSQIYFLNFNYSNTVVNFIQDFSPLNNTKVIPIHGTVYASSNPIIFGYGDDVGNVYHDLENDGDNELLRKIKSFQYPRTKYYHKLLSFLESEYFDVYILGHSCGLSDRTMLKTIFEHDKCLCIYRFHYQGEEEDMMRRIEISRHFTDKIKMRARVLPFDEFATIPQISNF